MPAPTAGATAVLLHLTYLRAQAAVSQGLVEQFPTRAEWDAATQQDPDVLAMIEQLAVVIHEVRSLAGTMDAPTLDDLAAFGAAHYDHALTAVADLATRLGVAPHDLLTVLTYG